MIRWLFIIGIVVIFAGWQAIHFEEERPLTASDLSYQRAVEVKNQDTVSTLVKPEPLKLTVILKEHYMDGVIETTKKEETIWSMVDFWAQYEGWTVENQQLDQVVFKREVKDISPLTKQQGYFGLTEDGELAVFQGDPEDGKVIEAFKPIPVKPLESRRKTELKSGIKIKDYDHFEQVLKQYSTQGEV
ncbi:BofC C-terminal domain-containing protein [Halobacillus mangrovi]|uniref:BofC C-terminal domain-containing protein n=1 Tax=Halobacillus mangrovi TaxID=402384 RepID=UPI003D988E92